MARILFGSMPNTGHVRPGLDLARELVAAGHEVTWYTGSAYGGSVRATGAAFVPMSPDRDFDDDTLNRMAAEANARPGLPSLLWGLRNFFIAPVPAWVAELQAMAAWLHPDVIVVEHGFIAGLLVAEKLGIPSVAFSTTPLVLSSVDTAPFGTGLAPSRTPLGRARNRALNFVFHHMVFVNLQEAANNVRVEVGLEPRSSFFLDWTVELATRYLAATIPEFEYPRSDLPAQVQFIGAMLPPTPTGWVSPPWWADIAAARRAGRPVIVVTQGTLATDAHKLLLPAITGLAGLDALVIGTTGGPDPDQVLPAAERPANLRLERFIPFAALLPQADLLVTNGGYGGVQQALSAGVPLVVAGRTEDKVEVSARVRSAGVGVSLRGDSPSSGQVAAVVRRVLTDAGYRERARELAALYARSPGTAGAVRAISEVAAGSPAPPAAP